MIPNFSGRSKIALLKFTALRTRTHVPYVGGYSSSEFGDQVYAAGSEMKLFVILVPLNARQV